MNYPSERDLNILPWIAVIKMPKINALPIYIFSYNRGQFLQNCVSTIEQCAPESEVVVIDDNSEDVETIQILKNINARHRVIRVAEQSGSEFKTGGLYGNMNLALSLAEASQIQLVLFIQDDMQFVRALKEFDLERIISFFEMNRNVIQYHSVFSRADSVEKVQKFAQLDKARAAYLLPGAVAVGKDNFSAVGVFHVGRVRQFLGSFSVGEGVNSKRCRDIGIQRGIGAYPFMNWLPYPSSYRGKRRNIMHRIVEFFGGAGFHPILQMPKELEEKLLSRDPSVVPVAEEWLTAPTAPRHDLWSTGGGEYNLIARGGVPALAFRALRRVKRFFVAARS
ncbi:glycosyltransferase family 2 protein [Amorphus sp. 3PC139-8]|uniref:glycosyltransferase family 2 protein n=1 Tax=Amorphus sp. 3PC139-8 TaxID=2735676 RepID=UPI00345DC31B